MLSQRPGIKEGHLHAQQKEELRQDVLRSRSSVCPAARLPSPTYVPEDPSKRVAREEQVGDSDRDEVGDP